MASLHLMPVFIPAGVKVNTEAYLDILSSQIKPWFEAHYLDGNLCLPTGWCSKKTQAWLKANLTSYWPEEM